MDTRGQVVNGETYPVPIHKLNFPVIACMSGEYINILLPPFLGYTNESAFISNRAETTGAMGLLTLLRWEGGLGWQRLMQKNLLDKPRTSLLGCGCLVYL